MNIPVNPSFAILKCSVRGCTLHGHVRVMLSKLKDYHQFSVTIEPSFSRIVSDFDEIFYDCLFSCQNT